MAIVPMKRLAIVAPADAQETLLQRLQELGALHLTPLAGEIEAPAEITNRLSVLRRQKSALKRFANIAGTAPPDTPPRDDAALLADIEGTLARRGELLSQAATLAKEEAAAHPWGDKVRADLEHLAEAGVKLQAWRVRPEREKDLVEIAPPPGVFLARFESEQQGAGVVAARLDSERDEGNGADQDELWRALDSLGERVEAPPKGLSAVIAERKEADRAIAEVERKLQGLAALNDVFDREEARLNDKLALSEARESAKGDEHLSTVAGWCPADRVAALQEAVLQARGGLIVNDPGPEDQPPIELKNGPLVRFFEPLLKAFQLPNYREGDPTLFFAPFMGLFFGFCLGDTGYGLILFAIATWARRRFASGPDGGGEMGKALGLIQVLGLCTVAVGFLTGSLFGIELYEIAALAPLMPLSLLNEDPANFFYAALLFGVAQLSFGMILQLSQNLRRGNYQRAIASVGWLLVIPGIAIWVMAGTSVLFLVSLGAILLFNSPSPSVVSRLGGGAWGLYNVTSLFGDVMSYARIFGLGLSSGIIAQVVNIIAGTVTESGSVVGYVAALLILLVGHTFNFAMAVIGSIVHPARLQFLEFFGKFFEGGGGSYRPLTRFTKGG